MATNYIRDNLENGENLVWSGRPRQGIVFVAFDIFLIPFSILWGGVSIVWEYLVLSNLQSGNGYVLVFFALFGLPFVVLGLYIIFGRFLADSYYRSNLEYGITDKRVIIQSSGFWDFTTSFDIGSLQGLRLVEKGRNVGTIHLTAKPNPMFANNLGTLHAVLGRPQMLFQIEGAREVFKLIRRTGAR